MLQYIRKWMAMTLVDVMDIKLGPYLFVATVHTKEYSKNRTESDRSVAIAPEAVCFILTMEPQ